MTDTLAPLDDLCQQAAHQGLHVEITVTGTLHGGPGSIARRDLDQLRVRNPANDRVLATQGIRQQTIDQAARRILNTLDVTT